MSTGGNRLSYSVAFFVLLLAFMTWYFDRHFKKEEADCQAICGMKQGQEGSYQEPGVGFGRRKIASRSKCECLNSGGRTIGGY